MDLTPYVEALRDDLQAAAAPGTDHTQETARLLAGALDAPLRLCLVDALSALAAEVTAGSELEVEIRMHGREPQVAISTHPESVVQVPPSAGEVDDRGTARITLRLPEPLKDRAEQQAVRDGLSVNAWLVRAVGAAVQPGAPTRGPRRTTGYVRG